MTNVQATQGDLTGVRKAAIVAVLLGEECAGSILKHLHEDEVEPCSYLVAFQA